MHLTSHKPVQTFFLQYIHLFTDLQSLKFYCLYTLTYVVSLRWLYMVNVAKKKFCQVRLLGVCLKLDRRLKLRMANGSMSQSNAAMNERVPTKRNRPI